MPEATLIRTPQEVIDARAAQAAHDRQMKDLAFEIYIDGNNTCTIL